MTSCRAPAFLEGRPAMQEVSDDRHLDAADAIDMAAHGIPANHRADAGVPIMITSPTASVNKPDKWLMISGTFRPVDASRLSAPGPEGDAAAAAQASRILINSATAGQVSEGDKAYLGQLVAARSGLSEADAIRAGQPMPSRHDWAWRASRPHFL